MTTTEKVLAGIVIGGLLYLVTRGVAQANAPEQIAQRVMLYTTDMFAIGAEQGVDPALIASVITVESGGDPNAVGAAGEIGLMQPLPATAKWIANIDPQWLRDTMMNISVGTAYIKYCTNIFDGNVAAGLAAYNYGPGRVKIVSGQIVVPDSVSAYVARVLSFVEFYRGKFRERVGFFYDNTFGSGKLVFGGLPCVVC